MSELLFKGYQKIKTNWIKIERNETGKDIMKLLEGINILFQGIAFKPNGSGLIFGFFFISAWFFIPMAIAHFLGKQMSEIYSWVNTEKKEGLEVFK